MFGFEKADQHIVQIFAVLVISSLGGSFFIYINAAISNVNHDQSVAVTKIIEENKLKKVYCEMLHNLDEGIILLGDNR